MHKNKRRPLYEAYDAVVGLEDAFSSLSLSLARIFSDSDFSCPQAARISRPRGVRIASGVL